VGATDGLTEGEEWTRAQLARLLQARFTPRAMTDFVVASQRRAAGVRRSRPEVARREALWATVGGGAWVLLAQLGIDPFRRRLRSGLSGWAATIVMLDWHLGMLETPDGRPRNLGPADAATLLRAWLVPAVADRPSAGLCAVGFATDVLDGRLARATEPTRIGRDLETLVDAAFIVAALHGARRRGWLGAAPVVAESLRLLGGFVYALGVYFGRAEAPDPRLLRAGRIVAPARAIGIVLAGAGRRRIGEPLLVAGSTASFATSLVAIIRQQR
jgi:phosphatidylglycerophosphate synthase